MNVLYHHRTKGGAVEGVHIKSIVSVFESKGHNVDLLTVFSSVSKNSKASKSGFLLGLISFVVKHSPEFLFEIAEIAYNLLSYYKINKYLKYNKIDMIYERYSLFSISSLYLSKKFNIPLIIEINDSAIVQRGRGLIFKRLAKYLENMVLKSGAGKVVVSKEFQNILENEYGKINHVEIIHNAVDLKIFDHEKYSNKSSQLVSELGIENKIVCGFIGSFMPWHGVFEFVKSVRPLLDKYDNFCVLLIGAGQEYELIENYIALYSMEEKVILQDKIDHLKIPEYISVFDLGIMPNSNVYGSPMKIFEMMSLSKPVIAPDYPAILEIIDNDYNGWIFKKNCYTECVDLIESLLNNPKEIIAKGCAAKNTVQERHTWEINYEKTMLLLERIKAK